MAGPKAEVIEVSEEEEKQLRQIIRQANNPHWLVERAKIILRAAEGESVSQIAREMVTTRNRVREWRKRWRQVEERRQRVEKDGEDKEQRKVIEETLSDAARSGRPPEFTAEEVVQIIAVSCESPEESGRPVTNWTPKELADEVIKRDIVESISPRQVGRFLKSGGFETPSEPLLAE